VKREVTISWCDKVVTNVFESKKLIIFNEVGTKLRHPYPITSDN